jgi:hypothetical protein
MGKISLLPMRQAAVISHVESGWHQSTSNRQSALLLHFRSRKQNFFAAPRVTRMLLANLLGLRTLKSGKPISPHSQNGRAGTKKSRPWSLAKCESGARHSISVFFERCRPSEQPQAQLEERV